MRKILIFMAAAGMLLVWLTGCSHNVLTFGKGFAIESTIRPDSGNFGVIVRFGDLLTVCARENTEVEMDGGFEFDGSASTAGTGVSTNGNVRMVIGPQITGYYVDAIAAGARPEELKEYAGESGKK